LSNIDLNCRSLLATAQGQRAIAVGDVAGITLRDDDGGGAFPAIAVLAPGVDHHVVVADIDIFMVATIFE